MKKIVVFTGAGVSADSGLATFRDSDGLWANYRIEDVCTPEALRDNRAQVVDFYNMRRREDDEVGVDEGAYPTPNVTLHKSYTTTESACGEDEYLKLRIETDADNAVKRISYDVPYEEYQVEYDIVVGNEVIDEAMNHPEFPEEEKLYKYEIKNRTKTKIRDIVNPATIEITYR